MKVTVHNHDATGSIKVEHYDVSHPEAPKQPISTQMIMPNQGSEGKEINVKAGEAILLTPVEDATMGGGNRVIHIDSQQNIVETTRVGVPVTEQKAFSSTEGASGNEHSISTNSPTASDDSKDPIGKAQEGTQLPDAPVNVPQGQTAPVDMDDLAKRQEAAKAKLEELK